MLRLRPTLVIAAFVLIPSGLARAQSAADPSGHWEGSIKVPEGPVKFEVDLTKNTKGELAATFNNPGENLKGLPLANVVAAGKSIRFTLRANAGGGTFDGVLSDDGKSITGTFNTSEGGYSIPFTLTRTGEAKVEGPARSAAIGKELEGAWIGTLDVNGTQKRLALTMSNQPDGSSKGSIVSLDGGGIEIPIGITQKGSSLILDVKMVGGGYAATLTADGTELVGTWTQGAVVLPLTFKRAPKRP